MTIQTKYAPHDKVKTMVDGGMVDGVVASVFYKLNHDGTEYINYEVVATWKYRNEKHTRRVIRTEKDLEEGK